MVLVMGNVTVMGTVRLRPTVMGNVMVRPLGKVLVSVRGEEKIK
jgi:hypothetical protein